MPLYEKNEVGIKIVLFDKDIESLCVDRCAAITSISHFFSSTIFLRSLNEGPVLCPNKSISPPHSLTSGANLLPSTHYEIFVRTRRL